MIIVDNIRIRNHPRVLGDSAVSPEIVIGKVLQMPAINQHFSKVYKRGGWGKNSGQLGWQAEKSFRFDGESFRLYEKQILGTDWKKIEFPAVYVGVVASAIKNSGYEVLASDISEYQVEQVRAKGLRAETLGFEQLPDGKYNAMVCFEPLQIIRNLTGYFGLIGRLSRGLPVVYIQNGEDFWPKDRPDLQTKQYAFEEVTDKLRENLGYEMDGNMMKIAYEYGAEYKGHDVYYSGVKRFQFIFMKADDETANRMSLDLELINYLNERRDEQSVSITALAKQSEKSAVEISASLLRLCTLFSRDPLMYLGVPVTEIAVHE